MFGLVEYVKVSSDTGRKLGWRTIWNAFSKEYPDRWAIEFFPPKTDLVDHANIYHLWVLPPDVEPTGMNISWK